MPARFLTRADDQFIRSAVSSGQREALIAKLRGQRKLMTVICAIQVLCLLFEAAGQVFGGRSSPTAVTAIALSVVFSVILLRDLATRMWLLEILRHVPEVEPAEGQP